MERFTDEQSHTENEKGECETIVRVAEHLIRHFGLNYRMYIRNRVNSTSVPIVRENPDRYRVDMTEHERDSIFDFKTVTIEGEEVSLEKWRGDLLLIVNTASECGFTPQYEGLESLWKSYRGRGFTVLGFPSNDFGDQEPGSNDEILGFCQRRFGVSFPLFQKGSVKGDRVEPLFRFLTQQANPDLKGEIKWNFEKFLIGGDGSLLKRFSSRVKPQSGRLIRSIESELRRPLEERV